jgi:signal transduction histidine kinase
MRIRYWLAGLGIVVGAIDTVVLGQLLGVTFSSQGRDVTLVVFGYLAVSFSLLGWWVGSAVETRRRERAALAALEQTRERVAQAERLALLGQLAAAISHEVRTPLAIVRSSVQNVAESLPESDLTSKKSCTFALEEIDRLTRVTSLLLGFARPIKVQRARVGVSTLFDRTELLARRLLDKKQLSLERSAGAAPLEAELDADLICQVLLGLIANAAEAAPERGKVVLEAKREAGALELSVTDTGPGVPPELREKIFDAFFTTRSEGTGLGLAVAKQLVEAHGGKLSVAERPGGGGARFAITLAEESRA